MSDATEPPHPSHDPSASFAGDDPWQDTTLWAMLAADPRLPAVTRTFIQSALTHFNGGDLARAEQTLYPATPGCVSLSGSPEIGAALMVLLLQVASPRIRQDPETVHDSLAPARALLERLHESRRGEPLVDAARALMSRFWATLSE